MKIAFLTEMGFNGKVPLNHVNMRTEFAWMNTLGADHFNLYQYELIKNYDVVFIIFPKAIVKLNAVGSELRYDGPDKDITIYSKPVVETLKKKNSKVCVIQEGPSWFFNEYDMPTQFNFYNQLSEADVIFAHNDYDTHFYKGLFPQTKIGTIPSLMIANENTCPSSWNPENKAIIGGNFCRWYGGFQSYVVATDFGCPICVPVSHCKRRGEEQVPGLTHLQWVMWTDWMKQLSTFKYAVNLMPTIAAGTFSMNCAYYGIPCIGNEKVDTQNTLFPDLSVDVGDVFEARKLASQLINDHNFYEHCSHYAKKKIRESVHLNQKIWLDHVSNVLGSTIVPEITKEQYKDITVVFTSCGRFDLLEKTLKSFLKYNTYPIKRYVVIDNSAKNGAREQLETLFAGLSATILVNEINIGQVSSIDKAYGTVNTEYIFHCEDDWEFFDYGFMEKSLEILEHDHNLININLRVRFDGERGSMHPITNPQKTDTGVIYHEYQTNYLGAWHGFSWNPGLRRLSDYSEIKPYKQYGEESGVGLKYYKMGKRSACLEKFYCKHIGQHSTTEKRNE